MLVGEVANRLAILIDDMADTSNTITRAAKLLKKVSVALRPHVHVSMLIPFSTKEGATKVYALIT